MPINLPMPSRFTQASFHLQAHTKRFESPFGRLVQRAELGGARWVATFSLPQMQRHDIATWKAFFAKLRGSAETFYAYDPDAKAPRGVVSGSPLVKGASQTGRTLLIDGLAASTSRIFVAGDYFQVGNYLHMITATIDSNGSGEATLQFEPVLRASPADNAPIIFNTPMCLMSLMDDDQGEFTIDANGISMPKTFQAVEVFS
jgi:hypothetical protein